MTSTGPSIGGADRSEAERCTCMTSDVARLHTCKQQESPSRASRKALGIGVRWPGTTVFGLVRKVPLVGTGGFGARNQRRKSRRRASGDKRQKSHAVGKSHAVCIGLQRTGRFTRCLATIAAAALLFSACTGGLRPTLIEDEAPTSQPALEIALPAAPVGTPPLPSSSPDFPLEASVDDALLAWAADRAIPYIDSCGLSDPEPGQLCDVGTQRDTVRLLGPSADEIWYVVTILETDSFDFGIGYRVASVEIAGQ